MPLHVEPTEWTIEPELMMTLVGNPRLPWPARLWEDAKKAKPTPEAMKLVRLRATNYCSALIQAGHTLTDSLDRVVNNIMTDADWIAGAQIALMLCRRYRIPLAAFAQAFGLKANHPDAPLERKSAAVRLVVACEFCESGGLLDMLLKSPGFASNARSSASLPRTRR